MVRREKIRMGTIDGDFLGEFEVEVQTEEEKEEERKRQYPDTSKASYLQYSCHYCGNEFYLINPIRAPNMNPLREGYICIYLDKYKKHYFQLF